MARKKSSFDGKSYEGYRVSLRLVREGRDDYSAVKIEQPKDIYEFMNDLKHSDRERFYSVFLNARNEVINCEEVSTGSANSTLVHPREVFKSALLSSCTAIVLVHNHPSGNSSPSSDDITMTRRLYECGELLGIDVLDSVIIGEDSYYSFRETGLLDMYKGRK